MAKIPLTKDGEKKLQEELKSLKIERPKISKAIAEAREHGDLKENAEYHAAREQQGLVEAKIKDIEFKLSNSEIIDNKTTDKKNHIIFDGFNLSPYSFNIASSSRGPLPANPNEIVL